MYSFWSTIFTTKWCCTHGYLELFMLTNNQIMVLNDAIYKIHTMEDFNEMRIAVLRSLEFIIPSPLLTF